MPPLLSILIPTHNRQSYAASTVATLAKNLLRSEIILCDTSPEDLMTDKINTWIATGRVRLIRPKSNKKFTIVDNFLEAARHASGDYIVFIGDDDFVHSSAEDIASWAIAQKVDAVRCTFPVSYYWPDFSSKFFGNGYAAKLAISPFTSDVRTVDTIATYREAMDLLGAGVLRMPRAYLGMVSRELVRKIETRHGSLFGGVSPDAYSAALIAAESSNCIEVDFPFIIPGSSGASGSGKNAIGRHKGKLRDNDHIRYFEDLVWDPRVPEFYSAPTVWSFSLIKAAEKLSDDQTGNFPRLYAKCLTSYPQYYRETFASMVEYAGHYGKIATTIMFFRELMREFNSQVLRIIRRIRNPSATADAITISNIANSHDANEALNGYLASTLTKKPNLL